LITTIQCEIRAKRVEINEKDGKREDGEIERK
jgi:hypothetical protein